MIVIMITSMIPELTNVDGREKDSVVVTTTDKQAAANKIQNE
jgi:hypothetical protein